MYCWSIRRGHTTLKATFVVLHCAFCKVRRNFRFFCSVNHLSRPLRKHMFTCDWCISIHFVWFCVSRLLACDCPVSDKNRLVFFKVFSDLSYSCKNKAMSASCPQKKKPLIITLFSNLEQSWVILSFVAGWVRCIVICINPAPTQMIDGTEKPIQSLQTHSAIQRIWL